MCIKRKSFKFENEIRIFIVKDELHDSEILKIPVASYNDLVYKVIIGPMTPYQLKNPRSAIYNRIQSIETSALKEEIRTLIKDCDVKQSMLYAYNKPLKWV